MVAALALAFFFLAFLAGVLFFAVLGVNRGRQRKIPNSTVLHLADLRVAFLPGS